jgi:hypothetical protein
MQELIQGQPATEFFVRNPAQSRHVMSKHQVLEGLRDSIRRIAATVDRGSGDDINDALTEFSTLASPMLKPFVKSQLKLRRLDGPDRMVDEAGDILNRLLLKLMRTAKLCDSINDEQAQGWLLTVVRNMTEDRAKTPRGRFWSWRKKIHSTMSGYTGRADDPQRRLYDDFTGRLDGKFPEEQTDNDKPIE